MFPVLRERERERETTFDGVPVLGEREPSMVPVLREREPYMVLGVSVERPVFASVGKRAAWTVPNSVRIGHHSWRQRELSSFQSPGRLFGRRGDMRDDSSDALFLSFMREAIVNGSGTSPRRDVHLFMLSIRHFPLPTARTSVLELKRTRGFLFVPSCQACVCVRACVRACVPVTIYTANKRNNYSSRRLDVTARHDHEAQQENLESSR